jgi:photosystem II stability/assembly factor-like uncharacterized protein
VIIDRKKTVVALVFVAAAVALAGWNAQPSGVTGALNDIASAGPDRVWAVGGAGTIVHTSDGGQNWYAESSGTTSDLFGVAFIDSLLGWAVGAGPTILHTTNGGASWAPQTPGISDDLMDVAFVSSGRGWASGINGAIIGTTDGGQSWNREITGIFGWYPGVTAASESEAWCIGSDWFDHVSPVYHYDGSSWTHEYDITTNQNGQDISVTAGNVLWAVADSGTVEHSTNGGANWDSQNSGTSAALNGVYAVSANYCWAVGIGGLVLATTDGGATWAPESTGVTTALYGIAMLDSANGWVCGDSGAILRRNEVQAVGSEGLRPWTVNRKSAAIVAGLPPDVAVFDALGRRGLRAGPGIYFLRAAATAEPRKVLLVK